MEELFIKIKICQKDQLSYLHRIQMESDTLEAKELDLMKELNVFIEEVIEKDNEEI